MKRVFYLLIIFFIVLLAFSGFFWLYEVRFKVGRASVTNYAFSIDNSYLFVTPLRARANRQEKIRVTVFVLNNQGLGVMGRRVSLGVDQNLNTEAIQALTDSYGKAFFDIAGTKQGEYYLDVTVDDAKLKQKAHLSFY